MIAILSTLSRKPSDFCNDQGNPLYSAQRWNIEFTSVIKLVEIVEISQLSELWITLGNLKAIGFQSITCSLQLSQ